MAKGMDIILIQRFVRPDREEQFLAKYRSQVSSHPDFINEWLTKLADNEDVPAGLAGLLKPVEGCLNYVNVAIWKDWRSFVGQCDLTEDDYDPDIEIAPRQRTVLKEI